MLRKLVVFCFCCLAANLLLAKQDSTEVKYDEGPIERLQISEEELRAYKENPAFNYEIEKQENGWWDALMAWIGNLFLRFFEALFGVEKATGFLAFFLRILPYLLLLFFIFLLIKFFLRVSANSMLHTQKNKPLAALSEEEHIIQNEDIQALIRKALEERNYRLAIRYYYLFLLQLMSEKDMIKWELQKTNDDYLHEIQKPEIQAPFRTITRLYDYIWYGSFDIEETEYKTAARAFTQLQKMVDKSA
ncbi:DUF4129 domain-containing protein [Poritiphilus flavus]|uniref:DUF4129 domain-containing protein n=1 Tax=Poritiphilus flavus TaxID=2697053 RepID=A0A6L9ECA8_9FLAO|nr:DUF4129 domain-containing protein [Poritiphilus flavus]NAS12039.1 DUF4129 domain-containing protein [Poritiphilus flavus]